MAIGDLSIPAFPHRVQRIGTLGDGGEKVCGLDRVAKQDKCVTNCIPSPFVLGGTNNHEDHDNPKFWTLDSLMELNGYLKTHFHRHPQDRHRGWKFDALTALLSARVAEGNVLPVGQLQLEIHARESRENFEYTNIVRGARPELAEECPLGPEYQTTGNL
ncbi:hypothetical protein H4582DRAFT_2067709 [Lactarius indigo]|nr:hypothetical protein H4582DRAFT_2067709 [Lactarius indigo]